MAGHGRQEIVGTSLYYANYSSHIISHYGIIWQNIIYNIGRQAGRLIRVLPVYGDNLCCGRYN